MRTVEQILEALKKTCDEFNAPIIPGYQAVYQEEIGCYREEGNKRLDALYKELKAAGGSTTYRHPCFFVDPKKPSAVEASKNLQKNIAQLEPSQPDKTLIKQ